MRVHDLVQEVSKLRELLKESNESYTHFWIFVALVPFVIWSIKGFYHTTNPLFVLLNRKVRKFAFERYERPKLQKYNIEKWRRYYPNLTKVAEMWARRSPHTDICIVQLRENQSTNSPAGSIEDIDRMITELIVIRIHHEHILESLDHEIRNRTALLMNSNVS